MAGLQLYVGGEDAVYPRDDQRCLDLHMFLARAKVDPAGLRPLLGPRGPAMEVDARLLKRDLIAICVVTSFMRRLFENPDDEGRAAMYDAIAYAGLHFSFDPIYGASHTGTAEEVTEFFAEPTFLANGISAVVLQRYLEPTIAKWRMRVTNQSSSTFFGIVMRHLGAAGTCRLFAEWAGMNHEEQYDLLKRVSLLEVPGTHVRAQMVESFLGADPEHREAAFEALEAIGAPLGELDSSSREDEIRAREPILRQWARKTKP